MRVCDVCECTEDDADFVTPYCCEYCYEEGDPYDDEYDGVSFADPGGDSALRAETPENPRDCPCPTCGAENVLTRLDVENGYQCNNCADVEEGF